jgi:hypothetical protein
VPLAGVLAPGALIYVEAELAWQAPPGWLQRRHRQAGQVHYHLFEANTA